MTDHWHFLQGIRAFALPAYQQPQRAYHNDGHVRQMLAALARRDVLTPGLALAVWGHDLVYDPRRHDNEERSAQMFDEWLRNQGAGEELRHEVQGLILATRHASPPASREQALIVDADLMILGAPPAEFEAYEAAIQQEYRHVPELLYRVGRRQVLSGFLKRARIYSTPEFSQLEEQARHNLETSLSLLA